MTVPVLTAVTDSDREAGIVAAFERGNLGVHVVRRCVDVADLLATAGSGTARAALLSADLRRFDREALARLVSAGVAVVVLATDDAAARRLQQIGVGHVLPFGASPQQISEAVVAAVAGLGTAPANGTLLDLSSPEHDDPVLPAPRELAHGRIVAVWGPTGAPGRTTLAVTLATELARLGTATLLVDADTYGGVVAQVLGLLDEAPGLAAATRAANSGSLDVELLARLAPQAAPNLRVLTGIVRADRWPELRPSALEAVYDLARRIAAVIVVDCGFCLEEDEELAYDTAAPRRNGATLMTLECADTVLAVGSADPVGLQRLVRGLDRLGELPLRTSPRVVVNRLRRSVAPGDAAAQVSAALHRYAGVSPALLVPHDGSGLDKALAAGRALAEVAPSSPVRAALAPLVAELAGVSTIRPRRLGRRKMGA